MSLEWFGRMENAVRISLPDLCEGFDEVEILFDTDPTEQHPSFNFSVQTDEEIDEFCYIFFDPINQEFYSYHYDDEAELHAKVLFGNLDQMLSFIHASFHDYLDEIDELSGEFIDEFDDELSDDLYEDEIIDDSDEAFFPEDEDHIEWITNDKYIHIEDNSPDVSANYSIYYKLGIDQETGDGVIYRNTIAKENDEETEEQVLLYFKEEEASYISELVSEYLNTKVN
ncbi:hypothetical protein [Litchfieldia salsa]|uniref:Uncharacterized protein n=1 Tax=Litchfieldia salsa TaxID=930152 RepID=A0A1H0TED3_9BACI|nr:hypothetical protein [Litchfieldia salsa]SDP51876.1 hypothetical protein SAMN05216565_103428 [Litchfieldia salsa]